VLTLIPAREVRRDWAADEAMGPRGYTDTLIPAAALTTKIFKGRAKNGDLRWQKQPDKGTRIGFINLQIAKALG